jgi:uncharacterized protein (TIGR02246 family)
MLSLLTSGASVTSAQENPNSPRVADILASVARLQAAWNAGSGQRWGDEFWPDATFVNILGAYLSSEPVIAAVHDKVLSGPFKGSTNTLTVRDMRFLGADAAIVEVNTSVTNLTGLPPGAVLTRPNVLETLFLFVYANRNGVWKIEAAQNTAVLPAPTSPAPKPT